MASRRSKKAADAFSLNAAKIIDDEFAKPVTISIGGKKVRVSNFHAIFHQLAAGAPTDRRALRVMSRYVAYAKSKGGVGRLIVEFLPEGGDDND